MGTYETFIILMAAAVVLVGFAVRLRIPYPIVLVIGGALIEFIPGLNTINIDPDLLQAIILPPILYYAAFWISNREFKRNWLEIFSLALGLVLATTILVGLLFKWLFPQFPWALAFAFGAIVSPPDAVVASAFLKRFNVGLRLQTILEGESLVNDATGIVLYKLAVVALLSGTFSFGEAGFEFAQVAIGGILIGGVLGYLLQGFSKNYLDPVTGVIFSFITPYVVYNLAQSINVSGVLAVVVNGLIASHFIFLHHSSSRRVFGYVSWDIFYILLNCFVFILIGSQLRVISQDMTNQEMLLYFSYGLLITIVMTVIRLGWVVLTGLLSQVRFLQKTLSNICRIGKISMGNSIILGLSGMRGVVSLTLALALPYFHLNGEIIAGRNIVVYISFMVILITIIIPPIVLPYVMKWLNIRSTGLVIGNKTRAGLLKVAQDKIEILHSTQKLTDEEKEILNNYFETRNKFLAISSVKQPKLQILEHARLQVLQSQREFLTRLWESGDIDDQMFTYLELEVDVEQFQHLRAEIK